MRHSSNGVRSTIQIGEAAQRTALTVDTIRFYERRALLPAAPRTTGQFRLYTAADVTRLNFIKQMQGLGFPCKKSNSFSICGIVADMLAKRSAIY